MRIFISSTKSDLLAERRAVHDRLTGDFEVDWMDDWGSEGVTPLDRCLVAVEDCDVDVTLLGHRYGSLAPDSAISYTEAEYEHARTHKRPVFAYIKADFDAAVERSNQPDDERAKLRDFRAELERDQVVERPYFSDPDQLADRVRRDMERRRSTGTRRPTFGPPIGRIRDPRSYAVERVRRAEARLAPFPMVLINLAVLADEKYPVESGGRLARKVLDVARALEEKEGLVVIFNDVPVDDDRRGPIVDQRLSVVKATARSVVCFIKGNRDLEQLDRLRDLSDILAIWHPADVVIPEAFPAKLRRAYTPSELQECLVAIEAAGYLRREMDRHLVSTLSSIT